MQQNSLINVGAFCGTETCGNHYHLINLTYKQDIDFLYQEPRKNQNTTVLLFSDSTNIQTLKPDEAQHGIANIVHTIGIGIRKNAQIKISYNPATFEAQHQNSEWGKNETPMHPDKLQKALEHYWYNRDLNFGEAGCRQCPAGRERCDAFNFLVAAVYNQGLHKHNPKYDSIIDMLVGFSSSQSQSSQDTFLSTESFSQDSFNTFSSAEDMGGSS